MRSSPVTNRTVSPALAFAIAALGIGLFSMMDAVMKSLVLAIGVYNALLWRQMVSVGLGAAAEVAGTHASTVDLAPVREGRKCRGAGAPTDSPSVPRLPG